MLRRIEIENFFSIRDRQVLDLSIAANATDPDGRFAIPIETSDARFPCVVALFGPNASGKTTFLKAIIFLRDFILHSHKWPKANSMNGIPCFSTKEARENPMSFFIEFDTEIDEGQSKIVFQYELTLGKDSNVLREVLSYRPDKRMRLLFERTQSGIKAGADFRLPKRDPVREKIKSHVSAISVLAQFNHNLSEKLVNSISHVFSNVLPLGKGNFDEKTITRIYSNNEDLFKSLNDEISMFDLGIERVEIEDSENGLTPFFTHKGLDFKVGINLESQGTKNFYRLYPAIWSVLEAGSVAVWDEFDNDIHPLFLPELIKRFQDPQTNPKNAQLIISCHNVSLLEHLAKEEVVFTEKDDQGKSSIYRLADIQGVRRDTNIYAKYLMGVYGAVPRLA